MNKPTTQEYIPERSRDLQWFDVEAMAEAIVSLKTEQDAHPTKGIKDRAMGVMGGFKRRGRQAAIVAFCRPIAPDLGDVTLHGMKAVMRDLFGHAVGNDLLCEWATKGRKANDRIDIPALVERANVHREAAKARLAEVEAEWMEAKRRAFALAGDWLTG